VEVRRIGRKQEYGTNKGKQRDNESERQTSRD